MNLGELLAKMDGKTKPENTIEKVEMFQTSDEQKTTESMEVIVTDEGKEIYRSKRFFLKGFNGFDNKSHKLEQGEVDVTMTQLEPLQVLEVRAAIKEVIQRHNFIHALGLALGLKAVLDLLTDLEKEG